MFLFKLIAHSVLYLVVTGLDVLAFFLVIRILVNRWPVRPLLALDRVGEPVTTPLIEAAVRALPRNWMIFDARKKQVAAAGTLLLLSFVRLLLVSLLA
jgi:hypothetical protein